MLKRRPRLPQNEAMDSDASAASIRFATREDALCIAEMSRDHIEHGLGWSWTRERILRNLRHRDTNAIVAVRGGGRAGFAIMKYGDEEAHLLLLAIDPGHRRCGVGSALVAWLERSARVAGISRIALETRAGNEAARAFYRHLGYAQAQLLPGYYGGRETSVRMTKALGLTRSGAL
jgi:ribosomal protein S18 acetylase RimI-like enzyme